MDFVSLVYWSPIFLCRRLLLACLSKLALTQEAGLIIIREKELRRGFGNKTDYASVLVSLIKMVWLGTDLVLSSQTHHPHHLRAAFVKGSIRTGLDCR
jgi:hypothetical protein